ncbi:hypothetical protein LSUB1_G004941 [Lachnellula subtilissima]|uniref:Uncharacterized protein n=1 Tax=Lachnellula subtilissima TaxID=602034 RepID=A0A8H8RNA2_9HELO|nr:hypothetical protein LSUB1_G004941 [Lachnellula subtilissima]
MSHVVRKNPGNGQGGQARSCKAQPLLKTSTRIRGSLSDSQERDAQMCRISDTAQTQSKTEPSSLEEHNNQLCQNSKLPTTYQPDKAHIIQQLYLAHFICSVNQTVYPWVTELPNILSGPAENEEIYAIRSATMALYGRLTAPEKESYKPCMHGAIGAAVLLSSFENIICTMPMEWLQHFVAAGKIFEVAGPENCQTGLMHKFFRSMRISSFITALTFDKPSVFASKAWGKIPFKISPKMPFDQLHQINLKDVYTTAEHLSSRLNNFWKDYKAQVDLCYDQRIKAITSNTATIDSISNFSLPYIFPFQNSSDAHFTSMYDSGNLIVLGYLAAASQTLSLSATY